MNNWRRQTSKRDILLLVDDYIMDRYICDILLQRWSKHTLFQQALTSIQGPHSRNEIKRHSTIHFLSTCNFITTSYEYVAMEWCRSRNYQFHHHYRNDNF